MFNVSPPPTPLLFARLKINVESVFLATVYTSNVLLTAQLIDLSCVLELDNYHLHTRAPIVFLVLHRSGRGGGRFSFDRQLAHQDIATPRKAGTKRTRHFSASFRSIATRSITVYSSNKLGRTLKSGCTIFSFDPWTNAIAKFEDANAVVCKLSKLSYFV